MGKFLQDFKAFALKGNVVDMAVGVVVGGAFSKIVTSLVNDLVMPLLSLLTGGTNVSGQFVLLGKVPEGAEVPATIEAAKELGIATFNYGNFIQTVIDFVLIALCIFMAIRFISKMHKKKEEAPAPVVEPRLCPFCCQPVDDKATRCHHCTSELPEVEA